MEKYIGRDESGGSGGGGLDRMHALEDIIIKLYECSPCN